MSRTLPYILALETSTPDCSVALFQGKKIIASTTYHLTKSHSRVLPSMVKQVLTLAKIQVAHLSAVAVSTGPGSYTGLRISASLAKGICYSQQINLFGIHTLEILLATPTYPHPSAPTMRCALLDARNKRSYALLVNHQKEILLPTQVVTMELHTFLPWLEKGPILFLGSGADSYGHILAHHPHFQTIKGIHPHAEAMGTLIDHRLLAQAKSPTKPREKSTFLSNLALFSPQYLSDKWA